MSSFTVDTNAVRRTADTLNGLADEYDRYRNKLLRTATSMGHAYQSADNRVYVARITEFCQQMMEVSNRLRTAAQVMKTKSGNYDNREQENVIQANKLH